MLSKGGKHPKAPKENLINTIAHKYVISIEVHVFNFLSRKYMNATFIHVKIGANMKPKYT